MSFYEACPILNQDDEIKNSRLMIADITSKILKQGLELLGIQTVEKM
jgi:arginyl-tRNA synthetase